MTHQPASGALHHAVVAIGVALAVIALGGCTAGRSASSVTTSASAATGAVAGPGASSSAGSGTASGSAGSDGGSGSSEAATGSSGTDGAASESLPSSTPATPSLGTPPTYVTLTGAMPPNATTTGSLVSGFPTDVVPVPDGIEIVSSSVSSQGDHLQLGLQGSTAAEPSAVAERYTAILTQAGFLATEAPALQGSTARQYNRGSDALTLTLRERVGGGTELSLTGALVREG